MRDKNASVHNCLLKLINANVSNPPASLQPEDAEGKACKYTRQPPLTVFLVSGHLAERPAEENGSQDCHITTSTPGGL